MPSEPNREETLFAGALPLTAAERAEFLERECAGDPALRERVESLLAAYAEAGTRMDLPIAGAAAVQIQTGDISPRSEERIGRYKLLEKIGEGGFGDVWMVEQEEPVCRRVALKIIKLGMDTREVVARFEAERQALALMDHPNIARVFDGGATENGRPYFVMELVRGVPITAYCDAHRLKLDDRLELFMQVCQAIQHAHQKGIIHRDLKPSNVLVTILDNRPIPKVIDFGIAKATAQRLTEKTFFTRFHQFVGTPAYMSPEQTGANREDIDTRSDIYSLGVLLYELLTGKTPFDMQKLLEAGYEAILKTIREQEPQKPSTRLTTLTKEELGVVAAGRRMAPEKLGKTVRGELDWIVMKCLDKDRTRRYETANGLAMDIQRHLGNEPVLAAPPSVAYRLQRFARRHRVALATALAFVVVLLSGIVTSTWQAWRANRFARKAENQRQIAVNETARTLAAVQKAERERQRAEASETEARHSLYVARIRSVREAWENNDMIRMRELLDQTRAYSDRGFEWGFWQRKTERKRLRGDGDIIETALFSPAGDRVIGFGLADRAYVWDWPEGRALFQLRGKSDPEGALPLPVALSPDGNWIAIGSSNRAARVCDAFTGQDLFALAGQSNNIVSLAFSPDGKRIAAGQDDNTLRIWDASSGKELFTLGAPTNRVLELRAGGSNTNRPPASAPLAVRIVGPGTSAYVARIGDTVAVPRNPFAFYINVAFSPDNSTVATSSSDGSTVLWNAGTGERLSTLETGSVGNPTKLVFFQQGRRLLTERSGNAPSVWDVSKGTLAFSLEFQAQSVTRTAISPDGRFIVTAIDRAVKLWDASTGAELRKFTDHPEKILCVAISPDGRTVVTAGRTTKLWDAATGSELAWLRGNPGLVRAMAFSRDGHWLLTGDNRVVRVWRHPGKPDFVTWKTERGIGSAAFSPAENRIAISQERQVGVWDAAGGRLLHTLEGHSQPVTAVAFSADGNLIASGDSEGSVKFWDASTGEQVGAPISHPSVESVAFSREGGKILTLSGEMARAWDVQTRGLLTELTRQDDVAVRDPVPLIIFQEETADPVAGGQSPPQEEKPGPAYGRTVTMLESPAKIWALLNGNKIVALPKGGHSAAISPDGRWVLTGGGHGSPMAVLWEADSGRDVTQFKGHTAEVLSVAFSPDGRRILTGSLDGTAKLWDAASGDELLTFKRQESGVSFVAFSSDSSKAAIGCMDGTFTVWESSVPED